MDSRTDNLHIFENVFSKKQKAASRLLYGFIQCRAAFQDYPLIMYPAFASLAIFTAYLCSYFHFVKFHYILLFFTLLFEVILFTAILLLNTIGQRLSRRFSMKLSIGIRDTAVFFLPLGIFGLYLAAILLLSAASKINLVLFVVFTLSETGLIFIYEQKIAPRKQHDLDIPRIIDADKPVDITLSDADGFMKHQVAGDTRNSFCVTASKPAEFKLKEKAAILKIAFAVAELTENCRGDIKLSLSLQDAFLREPLILFSRVFNCRDNYEEREWLDTEIKLDWGRVNFASHSFVAQVTGDGGNSRCYVSEPRAKSSGAKPRKVIFVVFDAVRHDHLGSYGYPKNVSPNLDRFAKDCVLFRNAIVQGEWTLTSFMSFLTSLYPSSHGVFHPSQYQYLHPDIHTLPQLLRDGGFITRCYFTHKRLVSNFGFARGFDSHLFRQCDKENRIANCDDLLIQGLDMLDFHRDDDLFLMLHFFDAHQPCNPPSPYADIFDRTYGRPTVKDIRAYLIKNRGYTFSRRDVENLVSRYDAEIYRQDKRFGALINHLKSSGEYEDALIIFTADHGMLLNDHGDLATIRLFDESLRVPLLIKLPRGYNCVRGAVVDNAITQSNLDIMPTILDVFGIKKPDRLQGESLLALCQNRAGQPGSFQSAISESFFDNSYTVSVRDFKYRYTAKYPFDFSSFGNIKLQLENEEIYQIGQSSPPEAKLEGSAIGGGLLKQYREIVHRHIRKAI